MTINIYGDDPDHDTAQVEAIARRLLTDYAGATAIESQLISMEP